MGVLVACCCFGWEPSTMNDAESAVRTTGRTRRVGEDLVVALYRPAELLSVEPQAMLERDARIESGADEIVNELLGRSKVQRRARIVLTLPAEQVTQDTAETLRVALRRYCEARLARVQREIEVAWRQGLRSLGSGSILFIVGLLLSTGFLEPDVPSVLAGPARQRSLPRHRVGWSLVSARPALLCPPASEARSADCRGDQSDAALGATRR